MVSIEALICIRLYSCSVLTCTSSLVGQGDGLVSRDEYYEGVQALDMQGADALEEVFAKVDGDNSGSISQEEFVRFCVAAAAKRSLKQKVITTKVARQLKLGNFLSSSEAQVRLVAFHRLITHSLH